jgi:hypothetical protein
MRQRPFIHRAEEAVRRSRDLSAEAKVIILEFYSYASPDGDRIRPSASTVAKTLGCSRRAVLRALVQAKRYGFLIDVTPAEVRATQAKTQTPNHYRAGLGLVTETSPGLVTALSPGLVTPVTRPSDSSDTHLVTATSPKLVFELSKELNGRAREQTKSKNYDECRECQRPIAKDAIWCKEHQPA